MSNRVVILNIFIFFSINLLSQVIDADRTVGKDSTNSRRYNWLIVLNGSSDQQKKNLVDVGAKSDFTLFLPKDYLVVFALKADLVTNGKEIIQNAGFFHLRLRDHDTRIISLETYTQYQWNGAIGMVSRYLSGANVRWRIFQDENNDIFTGFGIMLEREKWDFTAVEPEFVSSNNQAIEITRPRLNHYLKLSYKISKNADMVLANFTQATPDDLLNPRISSNLQFNFKISSWFGFSLNYDSLYDFKPVVPIRNYYYSLTTGFNFNF